MVCHFDWILTNEDQICSVAVAQSVQIAWFPSVDESMKPRNLDRLRYGFGRFQFHSSFGWWLCSTAICPDCVVSPSRRVNETAQSGQIALRLRPPLALFK